MLNCSRPDHPALLEALRPVFNLSSIRPVQNYSTTTHVTIDIILFGILGVDEKAQLVSLFIWQYLEWKNEFVGWDPEQCGASLISVSRKLLWVPDVVINEFMEENSLPTAPYSYLYSDGLVQDKQPVKVVSSCRLNMHLFPFDIQNCTLSFNSYLLRSTALRLHLKSSAEAMLKYSKQVMTSMGLHRSVQQLTLVEFGVLLDGGLLESQDQRGPAVSFRRQPIFYVLNLLIPSCFLITLDLFSFLLPAKSTTRSYFKITLILGYTVFLLNMSDLLPGTGNSIPLINMFLSLCLVLMMLSLLETILITNLCHSARDSPVPRWIRVFVLHILGCLLGPHPKPRDVVHTEDKHPVAQAEIKVSTPEVNNSNAPQQTGPLDDEKTLLELKILAQVLRDLHLRVKASQHSEEWIQVGLIIDRLLFGLYILFLLVSFSTITFLWVTSYKTT